MGNRKNKGTYASMEQIFVPSGDQPLLEGDFLGSGNALSIADKQLTVLNYDKNESLTATNVVDENAIFIAMGTPNSKQLHKVSDFNLNDKGYLSSAMMVKGRITSIINSKPSFGRYAIHAMTGITNIVKEQDYKVIINLESHKRDIAMDSRKRDQGTTVSSFAPSTVNNALDYLLQSWCLKCNSESLVNDSHKPFFVMAVDTTGASTGAALKDLVLGDTIDIQVDQNSNVMQFVVDMAFMTSLQYAIANDVNIGNWKPIKSDLSTAGLTAKANGFLTIGIDEPAALYDEHILSKVRVEAFSPIDRSFDKLISTAKEENGMGKQWVKQWQDRTANFIHNLQQVGHTYDITNRKLPNYINPESAYSSVTIEFDVQEETTTFRSKSYMKAIFLLESTLANPNATAIQQYNFTVSDAATVASLNAILGKFIQESHKIRPIEFKKETTLATPFL